MRTLSVLKLPILVFAWLFITGCADVVGADFEVSALSQKDKCPTALPGPSMIRVGDRNNGVCIDTTEVTRTQYNEFLEVASLSEAREIVGCSSNKTLTPQCGENDAGNLPVRCVDWCDAAAYCAWVGKRLCGARDGRSEPLSSEDSANAASSEWMYACSSGGDFEFVWGAVWNPVLCRWDGSDTCNPTLCSPSGVATHDACQPRRSEFVGVYDLEGNVGEWVNECEPLETDRDDDHRAEASRRCAVRGGSFLDTGPTGCAPVAMVPRNTDALSAAGIGIRCCY